MATPLAWEKGLFTLAPPHQGIDGEWTDGSGVIEGTGKSSVERDHGGRKKEGGLGERRGRGVHRRAEKEERRLWGTGVRRASVVRGVSNGAAKGRSIGSGGRSGGGKGTWRLVREEGARAAAEEEAA
ncbi:hypothetical protein Scep_014213 [Stephania cephalantha]|uniref:Uncharacterized protein n=1 Tax=Stephania cephalantha TaxID=152367 RepID=A0AAP0J0I0_9MAGN